MKKRIQFPVVKGKRPSFPRNRLCPWCKRKKVGEPHSMVILHGGAVARRAKDVYRSPTPGLLGFLELCWHGAHDGGEGPLPDTGLLHPLADNVAGGEFDLVFCSVNCLRAFLNTWLDQFERKLSKLKP